MLPTSQNIFIWSLLKANCSAANHASIQYRAILFILLRLLYSIVKTMYDDIPLRIH